MTTQENEWREEVEKWVDIAPSGARVMNCYPETIVAIVERALTTHSAHLVERISEKKIPPFVAVSHEDALNIEGYNKALDQAIDIIKDNKLSLIHI